MAFVSSHRARIRSTLKTMSLVAGAATAMAAADAHASIITDTSIFSKGPSTFINFETTGAGAPIVLIDGQRLAMPTNSYSPQGVSFLGAGTSTVYWVNDGNAAFDAAQAAGASLNNSIPSSLTNQFTMTFSVPVRAFGFFVANNRLVDPAGPSFVARDAAGVIIESAQFGPAFIDGTITTPNTVADYGFMGILANRDIASVTITKQAAILDDLRFTQIPSPAPLALAGFGGILMLRRRR